MGSRLVAHIVAPAPVELAAPAKRPARRDGHRLSTVRCDALILPARKGPR